MRVLICTPLYPPDIGGPATYTENLFKALAELGAEVKLAVVGKEKNIFLRYFKYFSAVYKFAFWAEIVYVLDLVSAGLPAVLAGKLRGKPVVFRTGGDFLWEKACQKEWTELSLAEYYEARFRTEFGLKEKFLFYFSRWILKKMDFIIFSTKLQAEIYRKYYGVLLEKTGLVLNAISGTGINNAGPASSVKKNIIFAGRLIKLKNLERLIRAFAPLKDGNLKLLIFGEGPEKKNLKSQISNLKLEDRIFLKGNVDKKTLAEEIASCLFVILPSISDISPNLVLECIGIAKPVIVTKNTGLEEKIAGRLLTIDPYSEKDIKEKMEYLLNNDNLENYGRKLKSLRVEERSWRQVAKEHLELFGKIVK